jgi:predicted RecB family nuclease
MLITEEIFQAYLKCETKSYLKSSGVVGEQHIFTDWDRGLIAEFKRQVCAQLRSNHHEDEYLVAGSLTQALKNDKCCLAFDCMVQTPELQSQIHILERLTSASKTKHNPYIPVRLIPREKITLPDKLLLAFDALVLSVATGQAPSFGKIIHGREYSVAKVKLDELMKSIKALVGKITAQQASRTPPPLVLNKHCAECEFQVRCRQIALEKDELSLLSGMTQKEIKKQHSKGIFSVTQLSYTFRARRKPKRFASKPDPYSHALRALAIRERRIHIAGKPELKVKGNPVYLDVEGVPNRDFYYLIGLRFRSRDAYVQASFWANEGSEEKEIWVSFLETLAKIETPQLIHYGSYEIAFLKRMKERYGETVEDPISLDRLIVESVNVLSAIYAHIYFPTYSNGLKETAKYLGFQWSETNASGLNALMWRLEWELSKDSSLKQRLVTYNAEDCEALEKVASAIAQVCQRQAEATQSRNSDIVHTDSMKRDDLRRFKRNDFTMPELEYINQAAYWDYQRERIYVRSNQRLKRVSRKSSKDHGKATPVNKTVEYPPPDCCPKCKAAKIRKHNKVSEIIYDLKFGRNSIRRWAVKHLFHRYSCFQCGAIFYSCREPGTENKYGPNLLAYLIYQVIELHLAQRLAVPSLQQSFGINISRSEVNRQKTRSAQLYQETYEGILSKIVKGKLLHADETKISIEGGNAFVWVFTSLEDVFYYYAKTREGDFLQELLQEFQGVLVSDFYAAYDSMNCPQQKCLIHLMRDLNDDLLKNPFSEELKGLMQEFASLLKPMIETVDRFGLKAHFLRKHKVFVERFYRALSKRDYQSEIAVHYQKRFEKNRDKLFTFLDYDGVPWNNNNAEHAIKAFARLRAIIGGTSTDKGIREYLTFLSIRETCKYKGVSFLEFLRSGEKDVDVFITKSSRVSKV